MLLFNLPPLEIAALLTAMVVGLTLHEYAHAWSAFRLGDPTAYWAGRLTLDPRKHIDPLGALVFLVAGFGWAKPVPIDPSRLGRRGALLVSLAGPGANLLLATIAAVLVRLGVLPTVLLGFLIYFAFLNLMLAVFNLLPVAPLDGWRVLLGVVPPRTADRLQGMEQYAAMALFALIAFGAITGRSVLGSLIMVPVNLLGRLLLGAQFS
jgi:Zn-dependent protease